MAVINNIDGNNWLNITEDDLDEAVRDLKEIIQERLDNYKQIAHRRISDLISPRYLYLNKNSEICLLAGLVSVVSDWSPLKIYNLDGFKFLAYYISSLWPKMTEIERNCIYGKIKSGLDNERQLSSLFFELSIGFSYLNRGNNVDFRDLATSDEKNFDLLIFNKYFEYSVEIKTINYESGLPVNNQWAAECSISVTEEIKKILEPYSSYLIHVIHHSKRNPTHYEMKSELSKLAKRINKDSIWVRGSIFSINLSKIDRNNLKEFNERIMCGENLSNAGTCILAFPANIESPAPCITLFSTALEWRLSKEFIGRISEAAKQLRDQKSRKVIWIQVIGSTCLSLDPEKNLKDFIINSKPNIAEDLIRRQSSIKNSGSLVGIHISGDYYTFRHENDSSIIGIDIKNAFITSRHESAEALLYQTYTLKQLPSKLFKNSNFSL